jgi:predicted nuclease of predicted toxin-antitoxin system
LRTGNKTTQAIGELLLQKAAVIKEFLNSEKYTDNACLEID